MGTEDKLEQSHAFLDASPFGRRLHAAEHVLNLLDNGELEHLRRFVFGGTIEVRQVVKSEPFRMLVDNGDDISRLLEASEGEAYLRNTLRDGRPAFFLFHEDEPTGEKAALYGRVFEAWLAVTYAALGFDMKGLMSLDKGDEVRPA